MSDELKVIAWITVESLSRLESGGNDSRGTVPVHVRHSRVAYRGLVLRTDAERMLVKREARIAELERERDEMNAALRDCLALAARHRHEEWAQHVMRFCANGGVVPSPLRKSNATT